MTHTIPQTRNDMTAQTIDAMHGGEENTAGREGCRRLWRREERGAVKRCSAIPTAEWRSGCEMRAKRREI